MYCKGLFFEPYFLQIIKNGHNSLDIIWRRTLSLEMNLSWHPTLMDFLAGRMSEECHVVGKLNLLLFFCISFAFKIDPEADAFIVVDAEVKYNKTRSQMI